MKFFASTLPLLFVTHSLGKIYNQVDNFNGETFLSGFVHETMDDPTHGRVDYVDEATALQQNLTFASPGHFIIRADDKKIVKDYERGRKSVRLRSQQAYGEHLLIVNVRHMPEGCATWPAIWEVGPDWPNAGEVDIVEGVNGQGVNQATLHTRQGCYMPDARQQTGQPGSDDCAGNSGCGVASTAVNSYGPTFNAVGGGWYAMERTTAGIKVWFWPRNVRNVPSDVMNGTVSVNPDKWGSPFAYFPGTSCGIREYFGMHNIIINLTFCGDWAGGVYGAQGCPGDCVDFVNNNPASFSEAYFDIAQLGVYV